MGQGTEKGVLLKVLLHGKETTCFVAKLLLMCFTGFFFVVVIVPHFSIREVEMNQISVTTVTVQLD